MPEGMVITLPWIIHGSIGPSFKDLLENVVQDTLRELNIKVNIESVDSSEMPYTKVISEEKDFSITIYSNALVFEFSIFGEEQRNILISILNKLKGENVPLPNEVSVYTTVLLPGKKFSELISFADKEYSPVSIKLIKNDGKVKELLTIERYGIYSSKVMLTLEVIADDVFKGIEYVFKEKTKIANALQ
ncbi:hypothetical protein [Saccharolobus shibatae]|uniref:Uncharacterized protein n=1 Tax=Saccharolobus shibatae TaxID=2286 RepID=A0A8F5GWC6_9CREN|nr:hypothetical protein [Saccharolobus shibatae]QXJ31934.1 hypothetical protein J5U21_01585 [Saccharolobus shibatae]